MGAFENMTTKLSGKVALITGASAGIGQAWREPWPKRERDWCSRRDVKSGSTSSKRQAEKLGTQAISIVGDAQRKARQKDGGSCKAGFRTD